MDGKINEQKNSKIGDGTIETDRVKVSGQNFDGKAKFLGEIFNNVIMIKFDVITFIN
jgi:hypothetical protein